MKTKEQKRAEAAARQAAYDGMTDEDRLHRLESGGHGHCREANELRERIAKEAA